MSVERLLSGIGSTEPSTFTEICDALSDHIPDRGDRDEWREFFKLMEKAQRQGYCYIKYLSGRIESVILTPAGASLAKRWADKERGLFKELD